MKGLVAPASRRWLFGVRAQLKTAGETPAPQVLTVAHRSMNLVKVAVRMRINIHKLRKTSLLIAIFLACAGISARTAHAAPYYVTVAGLGGEPDYEQRFTALANDLDKLFKAADANAHVNTFTGANATKAHLTDTLAKSRETPSPKTTSR